MAVKIGGVDALTNAKKGSFLSFNPGQYSDATRPGTPVAGDLIYNTDESTIQFWDGTEWLSLGCCS